VVSFYFMFLILDKKILLNDWFVVKSSR